VLGSNRLLHAILDQMLQLLPSDPAAVKRLDDMSDGELADGDVASGRRNLHETSIPSSALIARGGNFIRSGIAGKLRAVS
jgi:hypothetical protein